jgi:DNA-binding NtrC family response regulator
VADGDFRDDLFYRLNVVRMHIPALCDRREDIPLLVDHFLTVNRTRRGKEILDISHDALGLLMRHDFPGNVRELKNAIEYAFIVCPAGTIEVEHLPAELVERYAGVSPRPDSSTMAELEAQFLYDALARNGFNRAATARELGVHKTTLWRKMKKLNVQVPTAD